MRGLSIASSDTFLGLATFWASRLKTLLPIGNYVLHSGPGNILGQQAQHIIANLKLCITFWAWQHSGSAGSKRYCLFEIMHYILGLATFWASRLNTLLLI